MTRAEIFALYPKPWRLSEIGDGIVLAADGVVVALAGGPEDGEVQSRAIAQLIVEWSREDDEPQPDTFSG